MAVGPHWNSRRLALVPAADAASAKPYQPGQQNRSFLNPAFPPPSANRSALISATIISPRVVAAIFRRELAASRDKSTTPPSFRAEPRREMIRRSPLVLCRAISRGTRQRMCELPLCRMDSSPCPFGGASTGLMAPRLAPLSNKRRSVTKTYRVRLAARAKSVGLSQPSLDPDCAQR
jgi:hypothetical protein